jgi:hypothetical protein
MKKHFVTLNRTAATYKSNPLKASPLGILQEFFNYATPAEHTKAFDAFCRAALKEKYCWRRGSPGNALHYAEQLELLIEAAYLLYKNRHSYHTKQKQHHTALYVDAILCLKAFFRQASPVKWKKWLHIFTRAALSHQSAADEMKPIAIYVFTTHLQQLLSVAAAIVKNNEY